MLEDSSRGQRRRRRTAFDRARASVVDPAMAGTDDLAAALVADLAAGVSADRAERVQRAVALANDDVGLLVARVAVQRALIAR